MNYANAGYIYAIRNLTNGHMYIGSTTNYKSRWGTHRSTLRRGVHHSFILQRAWDKHGEAAFDFTVLVVCPQDLRIEYENRFMALQEYNVLRTPRESSVRGGWKHSPEFKAKLSALHTGKVLSEAHRKKVSIAATGRIYDATFREKARARQLGVIPSVETRARQSAVRTGCVVSSATRDKLSSAARATWARKLAAMHTRIQEVQRVIDAGLPIYKALKAAKLSSATYYKYLGHGTLPSGEGT